MFISYKEKKEIEKQTLNMLKREIVLFKHQLEIFDRSNKNAVDKLMKIFEKMVPPGEKGIVADNSIPDKFTAITGGSVATIFKRVGDDFLRIATSLKKEDGTRAVGTYLGKNHPGYHLLINGNPYKGLAFLFGKWYMTEYLPVKDNNNRVVGILFIGFDITEVMNNFKERLKNIKIGKTGYLYVVNTKTGKILVHPTKEGINGFKLKDKEGRSFIQKMIKKKEGILEYKFLDNGQEEDRVAAFTMFPEWNWLIVATIDKNEIKAKIN